LSSTGGTIEPAVQAATLDLGKRPEFAELFLIHYIPSPSPDEPHALVFFLSHAVFDGIGAFQIIDMCVKRIAAALANDAVPPALVWGGEVCRLPLAFADAVAVPLRVASRKRFLKTISWLGN